MNFSLNIAQLNSLLQSFITIYIKPHLKSQIKQVQELLKKKTITQTYQYLSSLCKKIEKSSSSNNNQEKQIEVRHGPILKKTYTIQQIDIDTNSHQQRATSAGKTPYSRKQNGVNQKQQDNKSADFTINKRNQGDEQPIQNNKNIQNNNQNQNDNLNINSNQTKINEIVKKLKVIFYNNQKKIQNFSSLSAPKKQLGGSSNYTEERDPFKKFTVDT